MRMLADVILLTSFCMMVFALFALQVYIGILRQKCVRDIPAGTEITHWDYAAHIKNSDNWYEENGDYKLCGNATGAGWVSRNSLKTKPQLQEQLRYMFIDQFLRMTKMSLSSIKLLKVSHSYLSNTFYRGCPTNYTCLPDIGPNPNFGYTNFDHFGYSMLSAFQLITLDFWENVYNAVRVIFISLN